MQFVRPFMVSLLGCAIGACTGTVGPDPNAGESSPGNAPGRGGNGGQSGAGGKNTSPPGTTTNASGELPMPLRRLTRTELVNTLRDLSGDRGFTDPGFPADQIGRSGFVTAENAVTLPQVSALSDAAAAAAPGLAGKLPKLAGCSTADEACARSSIGWFARRAYRRPLAPAELDDLTAFYRATRQQDGLDHAAAMTATVETMLQSPSFLYHWELGPTAAHKSGALIALTAHERAARLSYYLWSSLPDEALFAAADANALETPDAVVKQARRMLSDPRARDVVTSFYTQWLTLPLLGDRQKDPKLSGYSADLLPAMVSETQTFATTVTLDGDGKLATLLTAPYTFTSGALAKLYGVDAGATPNSRIELDPKQRAGILTQASLLAIGSGTLITSPVRRGKLIRENFLCDRIAPPPDDVPPAPTDPTKPAREQFSQHTSSPTCAACHKVMDPIGWGFEHYDAIGRYRTVDAGKPVDASGKLVSLKDGTDVSFNGALELSSLLAKSDEVRECVTRQWLRFAVARPDGDGDEPAVKQALAAFRSVDFDVKELIVAVTATPSFLSRSVSEGEVLQ